MKNKKQYVITITSFFVLILITYFLIFRKYNYLTLYKCIKNTNINYILLAIVSLIMSFIFAAIYVKRALHYLGYKTSLFNCLGYIFSEFYFSAITPSSVGGQPIEMYEMKKDDLPYQATSIVVVLDTLLYKVTLLFIGIIAIIFFPKKIFSQSKIFTILIILGLISTIIIIILLTTLAFSKKTSERILKVTIRQIEKRKIKNKNKIKEKIQTFIKNYQNCSVLVKNNKKALIELFIILLFRRIFLFSINYFIYKSFGLNEYSLITIIAFQSCITLITDYVPLPGGVMVAESLQLEINSLYFPNKLKVSAMLLQRSISFYLLVIISSINYFIFRLLKRKKAIKIENKGETNETITK